MKICGYLILLCSLLSCSGRQVPGDIIQPEKMQSILWDIARAQSLSDDVSQKDSAIKKGAAIKVLSNEVFKLHHISESDFNKSYAWYSSHPDVLHEMLDTMTARNQRATRPQLITHPHRPMKFDSIKKRINLNE